MSKGKLKIAILIESARYGVANLYRLLITYLNETFDVDFIVLDGTDLSEHDYRVFKGKLHTIFPVGGFRWFDINKLITCILHLRRICKQRQYDIVLSCGYFAITISVLLAGSCSYQTVLAQVSDFTAELKTKRSSGLFYFWKYILKYCFGRGDAVLACSAKVLNGLRTDLGIRAEKISVVHNPVDIALVREQAQKPLSPMEDGWFSGNQFHFITAGRLTEAKNYSLLIKAFSVVVKEVPECKLSILGDGELRSALGEEIDLLGVRSRVWMPGFKSDIFKYFAKCQCFVSSSSWEGFGNVIVEAMALGLPIIATDTSGGQEILRDETGITYGLLATIGDVNVLSKSMLIIATNSDLQLSLSKLSVERVSAFDVNVISKKYIDLFNNLGQAG